MINNKPPAATRKPNKLKQAVALSISLLISGITIAEEIELVLPETSVLGTREAGAPLSNVPASITFVAPEEIQKQQSTAPRIEDILTRTVPGFNPTNNGVRQIRGRTAQVFINGVPVNEQLRASSGADINLLSPGQLGGIEVSRGANSAYGFGSPGGIIALSTPRAESDTLSLTTRINGSVNSNHVSGSQQASIYQSASQIINDFDFQIGAVAGYDGLEYDANGDISRGGRGPSRLGNDKEGIAGLDWSLGYNLGTAGTLRFNGTYQRVEILKGYESDNSGIYREQQSNVVRTPLLDEGFRRSHTLNLTYENLNVGKSAIKVELLNSKTYTEAYATVGPRITRDEQSNDYYGLRTSVTTPLDMLVPKLTATYGLDYMKNNYYRPVYFDDNNEFRRFFSPDVTLNSFAPYLQGNLPIGDFRFSAGVRHEEYSGKVRNEPGRVIGGSIEDFDLSLFNAGVVYKITDQHHLFATYSQGAEISQISRAALAANAGTGDATNLDPQPAKSNQYEIGLRKRSSSLQYSLAAFYTESDLLSALQPNPADPTGPLIPLREPREIYGLEGTLNWNINRQWGIGGTASLQDGNRDTPTGETKVTARDIPPVLIAGYVNYSPMAKWTNTLQFDYFGSTNRFENSTAFGEGNVENVFLLHFTTSFKAGPGELRLGIRNLTNKKYYSLTTQADRIDESWLPEEGRRLSASYILNW